MVLSKRGQKEILIYKGSVCYYRYDNKQKGSFMSNNDDHDFFEANIYPHYNTIRDFLTALSNDGHLADDLTQNTMLDAFQYIEAVKKSSNIEAYLITIAKNNFNKHCRKYKEWIPIDEVADEIPTDEVLEEVIIESETAKELDELFDLLDDKHSRVLVLHYYYELPLKQISDIYGQNHNTIRSWHKRSIIKLQKAATKMKLNDST